MAYKLYLFTGGQAKIKPRGIVRAIGNRKGTLYEIISSTDKKITNDCSKNEYFQLWHRKLG